MCGQGSPDQTTLLGTMLSVNGAEGVALEATINPPKINLPTDPSQTAKLGLLTQSAGAISSAAGAFSKAVGDRNTARYNAQVADNAAIADERAGDVQAQKIFQQTSQLKGTQRASLAARGVDLGSGSPLDILTSTDVMAATDQAQLKANTQQTIAADRAKGDYYRSQASNASPFVTGAASLVSGAGKVAGKWYDDKKSGLFGS